MRVYVHTYVQIHVHLYVLVTTRKKTLNSLLTSYSLYSIIDFPTRTKNTTSTTIDNIFINKYKYENYKVYSLINGLSDHDAQVLNLPDTNIPDNRNELSVYLQEN